MSDAAPDPSFELQKFVDTQGGPSEVLGLINDLRQLVGSIATDDPPAKSLILARTWWSRKQLYRVALFLDEQKGRAFIGR